LQTAITDVGGCFRVSAKKHTFFILRNSKKCVVASGFEGNKKKQKVSRCLYNLVPRRVPFSLIVPSQTPLTHFSYFLLREHSVVCSRVKYKRDSSHIVTRAVVKSPIAR